LHKDINITKYKYHKIHESLIEMQNSDTGKALVIVGILLFMAPFIIIPIIMMADPWNMTCIPGVFLISAIGFVLIFIGAMISGGTNIFGSSHGRQRIPPVQYPRQATHQGASVPVKVYDCPNCGAPPKYVDQNSLCLCEFCGTKYRVR
jgi:hypothetical protein